MESNEPKNPISTDELKSLYSSPPLSGLNKAFRDELKPFAASNESKFAQDNIGNMYITRPGTDPSISAIALTFPLDDPSSSPHDSFSGALHTFLELISTNTKCDICLSGWSSPGKSRIGRDVWEEELSVDEAYEEFPELRIFDRMDDVSMFGFSASLEIMEVKGAALKVRGSALLDEKARAYLPANGTVEGEGLSPSRCPMLSVCGAGAIRVGKRVVIDYSEYVAKLFENFD